MPVPCVSESLQQYCELGASIPNLQMRKSGPERQSQWPEATQLGSGRIGIYTQVYLTSECAEFWGNPKVKSKIDVRAGIPHICLAHLSWLILYQELRTGPNLPTNSILHLSVSSSRCAWALLSLPASAVSLL